MNRRVPEDQAARDRAIRRTDRSIALSAGAGSGKTSVLVSRLIQHMRAGRAPSSIAAITFTEKAAAELGERVRDGLERALADAVGPTDRARLSGLLGGLAELEISTIHSFCGGLLRREALAAGWAPATEVGPGDGSLGATVEAEYTRWRRGFDARHRGLAVSLRLRSNETPFGAWSSASVRSLALSLVENRDLDPVLTPAAALGALGGGPIELPPIIDALVDLQARCLAPGTCSLHAKSAPMIAELEAARAEHDGPDALALACDAIAPVKVGNSGRQADWTGDGKELFKRACADYLAWYEARGARVGATLHAALVEDARAHLVPAILAARRRAARAEFSDLLFEAARLLSGDPGARARLARRYQVLLIDEVQDTDPIQAEVAALLARDPDAVGPWDAAPPRPGALFAVGDARQSIYRFRRADVATWRRLQEVVTAGPGGEALTLTQNFRSVPGVVDWVALAFSSDPDHTPQSAWRGPAELDPVVRIRCPAKSGPAAQVQAAARHVAGLIADGARVADRDTGELRPMHAGDVMFLLPSWTRAGDLQDALELCGVPSVVEGGSRLFERDEARALLDAMRAIDDPHDEYSVVATLRAVFGLSHEELARHRADGGPWRYTLALGASGAAADALTALRELHEARSRRPWSAILEDLMARTHARVVWGMGARGAQALANVERLLALVREREPGARTPSEVVDAVEALASSGADEYALRDPDAHTARVTSYFKAKGLEAPVVVLCCASRRLSAPEAIVDREAGAIAARASKQVAPLDWPERADAEKAALSLERRRWMYVAATRARDQLVLVHEDGKKDLVSEHLALGVATDGAPHGELSTLSAGVTVRTLYSEHLTPRERAPESFPGLDDAVDAATESPGASADLEGERRASAALDEVAAAKRRSLRWRSVVHLSHDERLEGGGQIGPAGGALVHEVMELLDLGDPQHELTARAAALCGQLGEERELDPSRLERCQSVLARLLEHPVVERARRAPERWREVPFAYQRAGGVVAGTIDLCFPTDATRTRWVVVDWKSHLPPPGAPLHDAYQRQLSEYASALLATITPCEHVETVLAGPHPEIGVVDDVERAVELVHEDLRDLVVHLDRLGHTPRVGVEVGEPVFTELELAWPDRALGLGLDLPGNELDRLERDGWTVVSVDTMGQASWPASTAARVCDALGVPRPGRPGGDDQGGQE